MSHRIIIGNAFTRERAKALIDRAPPGYVESWREVVGCPAYAVSDLGQVKRVLPGTRGRQGGQSLRPSIVSGYERVSLCVGGVSRSSLVHRLVCEAFHGPAPSAQHQVAHTDGDKTNNNASNLRWATPTENHADKVLHGTVPTGLRHGANTKPERMARGERHGNTMLTAEIVRTIRADDRTHKAIAAELGISRPTVTAIKARRNWGARRMTHKVIIGNRPTRDRAKALIDRAPPGYIMEIREQKRTTEQSDFMWGLLGDLSTQKALGRRHTPDDWKAIAMNACGWECQFIEGLDGRPFPKGFRSSQLSKSQMSTMIEWLLAFGAENGIRWTHEAKDAA